MSTRFQRRQENFACAHCGAQVRGDGYTNHCPACLHSQHVDVHPGDRLAECGGLMAPVAVEQKDGEYRILHRCERCGHQKWNRAAAGDSFERLLAVARQQVGPGDAG